MKTTDTETKEEKAMRMAAVDREQYETVLRAMPKLLLLLLLCICMFIYSEYKEKEVTLGNPYECSDCKQYNRACKEHKEFNSEESLKNKIKDSINNYSHYIKANDIDLTLENSYKYYLYNENWFNTECDFCYALREECDGCRYNREAIIKYVHNNIMQEGYEDKLCESCKEKKYPVCNTDILELVEKVYEDIN